MIFSVLFSLFIFVFAFLFDLVVSLIILILSTPFVLIYLFLKKKLRPQNEAGAFFWEVTYSPE